MTYLFTLCVMLRLHSSIKCTQSHQTGEITHLLLKHYAIAEKRIDSILFTRHITL